jgi:hypothetical protein
VKTIRCDNTGENTKLQKRLQSKDWKINVEFEYTARNTPQQNHLAELGFAIVFNQGCAMMSRRANVPIDIRYKLEREAMTTATLLDGLTVIEINGVKKSRVEHWSGGKLPKNMGQSRHNHTKESVNSKDCRQGCTMHICWICN